MIRLTGRSSSHFTRVVRIVADELGIPVELDVVHGLLSLDTENYGGHPALKIPTLHVDGIALFGTDNICRKLVERAEHPRVVLSHPTDLVRNAQELVWHAMSAQVTLVLGITMAKLPPDNVFFAKAKLGLEGAMHWLETRIEDILSALPPRNVSLLEVTLFCLVEHIVFRPTISLQPFPHLRDFATMFAARESAQRTVFQFDPTRTS